MIEISEAFDELHFFDGYLDKVYRISNKLLIPSMNIGVWEHPFNLSEEMKYVKYCVICLRDVESTILNGTYRETRMISNSAAQEFLFGGLNLLTHEYIEYTFKAKEASIIVEKLELSDSCWPVEPDFFKGMQTKIFEQFEEL